MSISRLSSLVLLLALGCAAPRTPASIVYDIGEIHRTVTTDSENAQLWFDRGLALAFNFNHEEAIKCFGAAAVADPDMAMAHWATAWALGPNYNMPFMEDAASEAAYGSAKLARSFASTCTPVERDLIEALTARYAWPAPADRGELDLAYANAMRKVYQAHPDDADVAALFAESLMQLKPWKLWSHEGVPAEELAEIREVLESSLARWPNQPALCHLYIHAMEAGPEVAKAIPAARRLEGLGPGLGHLVHMPSHIYVWTGNYEDVVRVNIEAVEIDDFYAAFAGRENFYSAYRIHNYHFVAYGAMWEGRRELALEYSRRLVEEIPPGLLAAVPDLFDVFTATPYHVLVRFGMWEELLQEPEPAGELHAARAVWRYARALAYASLGRVDEALAEQELFRAAQQAVPPTRMLFQNLVSEILGVADHLLDGEIEYRRGNYERAFEQLRSAVALDEKLNYDEPWGWMEPSRHALGALLTEQGHFAEGLEVYEANLARYPENGWALNGLAECLRGLGREEEALAVDARFEKAWARADVEIPGSCYCRTGS